METAVLKKDTITNKYNKGNNNTMNKTAQKLNTYTINKSIYNYRSEKVQLIWI